jgi:hypothetical protein
MDVAQLCPKKLSSLNNDSDLANTTYRREAYFKTTYVSIDPIRE